MTTIDYSSALLQVSEAVAAGKITSSAEENIRAWLTEARYSDYATEVAHHIDEQQWQKLDDVFWTVIPFGTGGRRGRMYPIGSNAINERTIGESARGLAEYVIDHLPAPHACAIAFDTRHNSPEFARLCAEIMVAAGFTVYFLDEIRSTPQLSFLVRDKRCSCGIMVTASHNPPSDNAVKCYWSTGGQLLPPHDQGVIDCVMSVQSIPRIPFDEAVAAGKIVFCLAETDGRFLAQVHRQRFSGPRDLKIIYSPLHGVGATAVMPALADDGFLDVEVFDQHAQPSGDFPNVPGHVSNPENPAVFDNIIVSARKSGAELILATDPDCDRLGCAAPLSLDTDGEWATFSGNQIGALLADFVLSERQRANNLTPDHYVVKTLVTTEMIRRIAESYGVWTVGDLMVGFKWIGGVMDELGSDRFVFGAEESHGYLVGDYARDKDGAVAAMLFAELAAKTKAAGRSVHEQLDALYWQHGYHAEGLVNQMMEGSEGMALMQQLMKAFRTSPPTSVGGLPVVAARDYQNHVTRRADGSTSPLAGPTGDMVMLDLADKFGSAGNYIAVRPSGTEPKVKFYLFAFLPAEQLGDLAAAKSDLHARLQAMQTDLRAFSDRTTA